MTRHYNKYLCIGALEPKDAINAIQAITEVFQVTCVNIAVNRNSCDEMEASEGGKR